MDREGRVASAVGEAEHRIVGDLVGEANAAAAHDAALVVEPDAGTDIDVLWLLDLALAEAALALAVLDAVLLEAAFTGLVADGAIEGVIDEEELHHALPALLSEEGIGADAHVVCNGIGAGNGRTRHPADGLTTILVTLRLFTGFRPRRHAHLHEAHAAVAGRGELGVVAVMRHHFAHLTAGFDHPSALGKLMPLAVNLHIDHVHGWRSGLGLAGGSGIRHGTEGLGRAFGWTIREVIRWATRYCEKFHKVGNRSFRGLAGWISTP